MAGEPSPRHRGGGLIQLTGRGNYHDTGVALGLGSKLEDHPELLRQPATAFSTAVAFWKNSGANTPADKDDVAAVRLAINGGSNGLADVKIWLAEAKKVFRSAKPAATGDDVIAKEETAAVLAKLQELGIVTTTLPAAADNRQIVTEGLKRFQEEHGLSQTGVLDEDTLYELTDPRNRVRD